MPAMAALTVAALAATVAAAVLWPASDQVVLPHRHDALWYDHPHGHDDLHHAHRHEDAPTPTAGEPRHTHRHYHPPVCRTQSGESALGGTTEGDPTGNQQGSSSDYEQDHR